MELKGEVLNKYFRSMESVAHDNWEPGRHANPKEAKKYYEEIKEWIRKIVAELAEYTSDDEMEVKGLSGVLQQELDIVEANSSDKKRETLNDYLENIDIIKRPEKNASKGFFFGKGDLGNNESMNTTGTLQSIGEPAIRILKGERKRKKRDSHRGLPDLNGKDIVVQKKFGGESACPLKSVRVIKKNMGVYSVNFEIPHDVEVGRIELVSVGENGKLNRIHVKSVSAVDGCNNVKMTGEYIEIKELFAAKKIKIDVQLIDTRDYAMEVNLYEYK